MKILKSRTPEQLAKAYKSACMAELQALKPGNVHVFADGHGMTIHDFIKSADVTSEVIARPNLSVGERIAYAVDVTQQAVGQNTNLGMLLLCAPLIHAALHANDTASLRQAVQETLMQLTIDDGKLVAKSIVLANPAGLGDAQKHDVRESPEATLLEMMRAAQEYDRVAWQYDHTFQDVLGFGVQRYQDAMLKWQNSAWATTALYLGFLAHIPDTHVVRKYGKVFAEALLKEALEFEVLYWRTDNPKLIQQPLLAWDASLKARNINPGTSADLTVATLLVTFLD